MGEFSNSCYEVMVHKLCQEKCLFCSQDHASRITDIKPEDKDIFKRILLGSKKGYGMLGLTGGEPLIHKNILTYIKFAKKAGFGFVRIQTNGVRLGDSLFTDACIDAGATLFKLSIHHYIPKIHDELVGLPGALEKVFKGINRLRERGARIGINIVLTEQNYRDLPEFLQFYLDMGVSNFVIIYPLYENSMMEQVHKVGFRFTDTLPYLIRSFLLFDKLGLKRPLVLNLPMCLAEGYTESIIDGFNGTAVMNLDGSQTNIDDNKAGGKKRVPLCKNCKYNTTCYGVDQKYLNIWGESEFFTQVDNSGINLEELETSDGIEYYSDDELCFLEILKLKDGKISFSDILELKDDIQICKDCDSNNKIIATANILEKKGIVKRVLITGKIYYEKT